MNYTAYVIVTESTLLHVKVQKLKRKLRGVGGPGDGAGTDGTDRRRIWRGAGSWSWRSRASRTRRTAGGSGEELVGGNHGAARRGLLRGSDGVMRHCGGEAVAEWSDAAAGSGGRRLGRTLPKTGWTGEVADFDHLGPY
jgi:hypothetical protein